MYKTISTLFLLVGFHQNLRASLADSLQSERMEEVEVKAYSPRTLSDDRNGRLYWNMESLADMLMYWAVQTPYAACNFFRE